MKRSGRLWTNTRSLASAACTAGAGAGYRVSYMSRSTININRMEVVSGHTTTVSVGRVLLVLVRSAVQQIGTSDVGPLAPPFLP